MKLSTYELLCRFGDRPESIKTIMDRLSISGKYDACSRNQVAALAVMAVNSKYLNRIKTTKGDRACAVLYQLTEAGREFMKNGGINKNILNGERAKKKMLKKLIELGAPITADHFATLVDDVKEQTVRVRLMRWESEGLINRSRVGMKFHYSATDRTRAYVSGIPPKKECLISDPALVLFHKVVRRADYGLA